MSGTPQPFPSDTVLERRVLEGLVNVPGDFVDAFDLDAECFYLPSHRRLLEACKELRRQKVDIDPVVLLGRFPGEADIRELVVGLGYPSGSNVTGWCDALRALRTQRKVMEAGLRVAALGYGNRDPLGFADQASKLFSEALNTRGVSTKMATMGDVADAVMTDLRIAEAGGRNGVLSTGFKALDGAWDGLEPGRVYAVAGRPGTGKSALANHIALNVAARGDRVLICNLEMIPKEVGRRMACSMASIDSRKVKRGILSPREAEHFTAVLGKLSKFPIEYPNCADITIEELRRMARARKRDGLKLIVIDYLQLMKCEEGCDNREQTVAAISRGVKQMALELELPIIEVAQLNREADKRSNQRPQISDMRESGAIEQDADVITLLYRGDANGDKSAESGVAEVIVGKNRDGSVGVVKMIFEAQYTRFKDIPNGQS